MDATLPELSMKRARNWLISLVLSSYPATAFAQVVTEFAPVDEPSPPPSAPSPPAPTERALPPPPPISAPSRAAPVEAPAAKTPPSPVDDPRPVLNSNSATRIPLQDTGTDETPSLEEDALHRLALTFSAARAVASLYEVTAEVRLGERIGLAALLGLGSLDAKHPSYPQTIHLSGRELGAQARVYVIGDFDHGLMLGGELLRIWAEASPTLIADSVTINGTRYDGTALLSGEGTLTGLGAFIGYKVTASFGLTFDAKVGWQKLTLDGTGRMSGQATVNGVTQQRAQSESIRESTNVPLFNLNLGWSI